MAMPESELITYLVYHNKKNGLLQIQKVKDPAVEVLQELNKKEAIELLKDLLEETTGEKPKAGTIVVSHFDGDLVDSYAIG